MPGAPRLDAARLQGQRLDPQAGRRQFWDDAEEWLAGLGSPTAPRSSSRAT